MIKRAKAIREIGFDLAISSASGEDVVILLAGDQVVGVSPVDTDPCEALDNIYSWLHYLLSEPLNC
tara:strand:+ start:120 stop:317 length:198 start_codon:yes stop_codon:yes gene_type:complete